MAFASLANMSEEQEVAARYRGYAEKLRAIAKTDRIEQTRRALLSVAKNYERMAEMIEAIDRTNKLRES